MTDTSHEVSSHFFSIEKIRESAPDLTESASNNISGGNINSGNL